MKGKQNTGKATTKNLPGSFDRGLHNMTEVRSPAPWSCGANLVSMVTSSHVRWRSPGFYYNVSNRDEIWDAIIRDILIEISEEYKTTHTKQLPENHVKDAESAHIKANWNAITLNNNHFLSLLPGCPELVFLKSKVAFIIIAKTT